MNYKKIIKRLQIINVVLVALLILLVGSSLAIYTSQVYQRAVVRNRYNDVVRFSSDKLLSVTKGTHATEIYYPVAQNQNTITFTVCNYNQEKSTIPNDKDITYTISFVFENVDENFEYKVACNGIYLDSIAYYENTLTGGTASVDTYTITFSENDYQKMKLTVTVTPDDLANTKNSVLAATLIPVLYGTTQQYQVHMEFPDSLRYKENGELFSPNDVAAYNVVISVSGGEGDVLIRWKSDEIEMESYFRDTLSMINDEKNGYLNTVLHMNSADQTTSYSIPFYNPGPDYREWATWDELKQYIEVSVVDKQLSKEG